MNFGIATLKAPKPQLKTAVRHDCGSHGHLTVKQIARLTGMSEEGVYGRIYSGFVGEDLCQPKHESARVVKDRCQRPAMQLAMKLARAFPDRLPAPEEIQRVRPMSLRNAQRWRQAMNDANGGDA